MMSREWKHRNSIRKFNREMEILKAKIRILETNPFSNLPKENYYKTIVVDFPWIIPTASWRQKPPYPTMSPKEMEDMHIDRYAAKNAHLYLWAITAMPLEPIMIIKSMPDFRISGKLYWKKTHFGLGYNYRNIMEEVFFCTKGKLRISRRNAANFLEAKRGLGGHSSKPDEFYALVESCSPGPYLDIFGRVNRPGWDVWGPNGMFYGSK